MFMQNSTVHISSEKHNHLPKTVNSEIILEKSTLKHNKSDNQEISVISDKSYFT